MTLRRLAAALAAALSIAATARFRSDPAVDLARVRIFVTGSAATIDVTVTGATLASYAGTIVRAPSGSTASQTGSTMRVTNRGAGQPAEAQFDAVLAGVKAGTSVTWSVSAAAGSQSSIEVYSLIDLARPTLVDRATFDAGSGQLGIDAARLASAGALTVTPFAPRLVIAEYYPWYTLDSWRDPQFADQPLHQYSSDDPAALERQATEARSAGIDAFAISWQNGANPDYERRTRLMLDAAARAGIRVALFVESYIVNPAHSDTQPVDPRSMAEWLEDAVDRYGNHPAYLRVNGRPVVFAFVAFLLDETQWRGVLASVRATGRNPIVIGDFVQNRGLGAVDGEFQYTNVTLSPADLLASYRGETLRVRTFDLLAAGSARRIWTASVTPGYDDRRLTRAVHTFVDRANGAVYEQQWDAALATAPDWVMITTWNEFYENTVIEPSARYGSTYLDATRRWTTTFKKARTVAAR